MAPRIDMTAQQHHVGSWRKRLASIGEPGRHRTNPWLVGLCVTGAVTAVVLSILPGSWISLTRRGLSPAIGDVLEPALHFLGYAVLVGLVSLALNSVARLVYVYLAALLISGAMELVQLLVPERGASFEDFSMNVLGATAGLLFGVARLKWGTRPSGGREPR